MSIRVLLVDDEVQFIELFTERLQARGFEVQTASDGDEAILKVQQTDIDVTVLDVLMPGRDGLETLKELKKAKPLGEVIMLTGHDCGNRH